jgi:hypothetical protein
VSFSPTFRLTQDLLKGIDFAMEDVRVVLSVDESGQVVAQGKEPWYKGTGVDPAPPPTPTPPEDPPTPPDSGDERDEPTDRARPRVTPSGATGTAGASGAGESAAAETGGAEEAADEPAASEAATPKPSDSSTPAGGGTTTSMQEPPAGASMRTLGLGLMAFGICGLVALGAYVMRRGGYFAA